MSKLAGMSPLSNEKHVIVEILGGDVDGLVLDSKNPDELKKIEHVLVMTNNGEVGHGFQGVAISKLFDVLDGWKFDPKAIEWRAVHFYRVKERLDEGNSVLIRLGYDMEVHEYKPTEKPPESL